VKGALYKLSANSAPQRQEQINILEAAFAADLLYGPME